MTGTERRNLIIEKIQKSSSPLSGSALASLFNVSRQVIVQDIALIRASGYDIISTHRGYILTTPHSVQRVFKVYHNDELTKDELCSIVDLGGTVLNVIVNHKVYGQIEAELGIRSRKNITEFIQAIECGKSSHLKNITSGYHYHTVEADSEETLDQIEDMLREKNILVKN
ncbi:MAG: transcription repressor NadR [Schaedlerella sp.]|nr:transcription repressor NadR [Schaedlerella sp.]